MTKKTYSNKYYPDYKIMVKLVNGSWRIHCKHSSQNEWHCCYVEKPGDTWRCIDDYANFKDTDRMFDYTVSVYNAEVFGE